MADGFANAVQTTLNGSIDNSQTSVTVTSSSNFPPTPFRVRIKEEGGYSNEICTVTNVSGTTWTVIRASEAYAGSSSASAHSSGALVEHVLTAGSVKSLINLADIPPISPSAYDDEFNNTLSGWTTLGGFDTLSANTDFSGHLYMKKITTGYLAAEGIYKAAPSMPFTVTAKLSDYSHNANYSHVGLLLAEASPGKLFTFGPGFHTSATNWTYFPYTTWTNRTTRTGYTTADGPHRVPYIRLIVTSSTNVTCQTSENGLIWWTRHTSINPGFTVANIGFVLSGMEGTITIEAAIDYIRFT